MNKRILGESSSPSPPPDWLDLEQLADAEITSEDPAHPLEAALRDGLSGWRAATPGEQRIRFLFHRPQNIQLIHLQFIETQIERLQEYALSWSPSLDHPLRNILRQQWVFSPQGATTETENHPVNLPELRVLDLQIRPHPQDRTVLATLARLRLA